MIIHKVLFFTDMSYAKIVQGNQFSPASMYQISSQAELELGYPLSKAEQGALFGLCSPERVLDRIQRVGFLSAFIVSLIFSFSMGLGHSSS